MVLDQHKPQGSGLKTVGVPSLERRQPLIRRRSARRKRPGGGRRTSSVLSVDPGRRRLPTVCEASRDYQYLYLMTVTDSGLEARRKLGESQREGREADRLLPRLQALSGVPGEMRRCQWGFEKASPRAPLDFADARGAVSLRAHAPPPASGGRRRGLFPTVVNPAYCHVQSYESVTKRFARREGFAMGPATSGGLQLLPPPLFELVLVPEEVAKRVTWSTVDRIRFAPCHGCHAAPQARRPHEWHVRSAFPVSLEGASLVAYSAVSSVYDPQLAAHCLLEPRQARGRWCGTWESLYLDPAAGQDRSGGTPRRS